MENSKGFLWHQSLSYTLIFDLSTGSLSNAFCTLTLKVLGYTQIYGSIYIGPGKLVVLVHHHAMWFDLVDFWEIPYKYYGYVIMW